MLIFSFQKHYQFIISVLTSKQITTFDIPCFFFFFNLIKINNNVRINPKKCIYKNVYKYI